MPDRQSAHLIGSMGERQQAVDIADGEDVVDRRAHLCVDLYRSAGEAIKEAVEIIVRMPRVAAEEAEVRKTSALIAYGRELYYAAYKDLVRVDELGYEMDADFVKRLEQALTREAHNAGVTPPKMPTRSGKTPTRATPPALRLPY